MVVPGYGVSRGEGPAPMIWGDEEESRASEFAATELPDARFREEERSTRIGITFGAPEADPLAERGGVVDVEGGLGSSTGRRRISPRHRAAVKTFFGQNGPVKSEPSSRPQDGEKR